jgi:predicted PurR-regulated permease PerM
MLLEKDGPAAVNYRERYFCRAHASKLNTPANGSGGSLRETRILIARSELTEVMARPHRNHGESHLLVLVSAVVIIATLYFAKAVLVPFALAILFTFILTPPVSWLERIRVPRFLAVLLMVLLALGAVGSLGWVVTNQLAIATSHWSEYRSNIKDKIDSIRKSRPQSLNNAAQAVQEISTDLNAATPAAPVAPAGRAAAGKIPGAATATAAKPIPVEIVSPQSTILESVPTFLGPIGTAGIVLVFTIFMLLQREDLRNRFIRLAGDGRLSVMTHAMEEAGERVSHYLFLQSMVNASYGLIIGFSLYLMHVPNAVLFGVIAGVLRFLPYIGPPMGALLPVMLSLAVFNDWTRPLMVLGIYVVVEIVVANFVEPMLYGTKTGISSLAVLVAAVFWTFIWGPIGLVLSTPLTVCLVVMGRHLPSLRFLNVLLGDEPVLSPEVHYYQRLLATDFDEARQVLKGHLKEKSLEELYDSVLIPALTMAEQDRHRNELDEETATFIYQSTREFLDELSAKSGDDPPAASGSGATPVLQKGARVICVPASGDADEIAGVMLAQLLSAAGHDAKCISIGTVEEMMAQVARAQCSIVCVSAIPPIAVTHARAIYARLREQFPSQAIIVGLWNYSGDIARSASRIDTPERVHVLTMLAEVVLQVKIQAELDAASPEQARRVSPVRSSH